jgi:prepilin-type N-terminal cleavage/methylation domain-containing protein
MSTARPPDLLRDSHGFTLSELLVTMSVFAVISLGLGSLYLSTTRAMDDGSTMIFVQRQATQIQEELARHTQRATVLEADPPGATASLCNPSSGVNLSPGKSMIYQRAVGSSTSPTSPATDEFWCVYEYQGNTDAYAQLWRCQVSGLTPPQVCTTTPENLIASALRAYSGLPIGVSGTCFTPTGTTCPPPSPNCAGCPMSVDVTFALDVKRSPTGGSLLGGALRFGSNITIRN